MSLFRSFCRQHRPARPRFRPTVIELEPRLLLSTDVLTYHNDVARTGQNLAETILTPSNVNATDFGQLFTNPVDGAVYAQPLYKADIAVPGQGAVNLVFVATEHDSVYAFNADTAGPAVWHDSFIDPAAGVTTVSDDDLNSKSIAPEVGITSTPAIDPTTNTLYVVAFTKEVSGAVTSYVQRLHALDLATGAEKLGGPVLIQATVPGTGPGSSGGVVSFDAFHENQRPGLLLENGVVYIAWASFDDHTPYHGWVIGYNAQTLQQVAAFNSTPDGGLGGIWESGDGPAADAAGNIYVITGNGTFDGGSATPPNDDYGDTFLELTPTAGGLTLTSSFTPFNQATLDARDEDLGSGGPIVLPDQPGAAPHLLIAAGKEGKIYVLNRDALGGFDPSTDHVVQELPQAITSSFDTPAYFNGQVYFGGVADTLKAFALQGGLLSSSPTSQSSVVFGYPGTTPSISANGAADGIVWVIQNGNSAVLRAYRADNLGVELYDSGQAGSRDALEKGVKFAVPTVVNGKVYVGTQSGLTVFGLLPAGPSLPSDHPGVFDPATATWYLRNTDTPGAPDVAPFQYGGPNWISVAGDWNGDGTTTIGVVDPTTMTWYLKNSNGPGAPDYTPFQYGAPGWIPVVGDWDGNGTTTIGAFDLATATFYLRNENGPGAPDAGAIHYGGPGWLPVAGDWDGNGITTIGVVDPTTETWYLKNSNTQGAPDYTPFRYGGPGWTPVVGDWDGNGTTTVGVFDPAGQWYLRNSNDAGAPSVAPFAYGAGNWQPVAGDWAFPALPLLATDGANVVNPSAGSLSAADLAAARDGALQRLRDAGVDPAVVAELAGAQVEVAPLPAGYLGAAFVAEHRVVVSANAAGYGWFVDATPGQDEEFGADGTAVAGGPAAGRMDLLSVVLHEFGHIAGDADDDGTALMAGTLAPGTRHLGALDAVFAGAAQSW